MSGGYTHISVAQFAIEEVCSGKKNLLHKDVKQALRKWKKFCIVGAVGPDYPYLDILDSDSCAWADLMHKGKTAELLRNAVIKIRNIEDVNLRQKCMAWLFGFASHIATDCTVHPIVNLKVGPYEQNKTEHRRCEMSQDVYIHERLNLGALENNRQISRNVKGTSDVGDPNIMDQDIVNLWYGLLTDIYSGTLGSSLEPPKINDWHRAMLRVMSFSENRNKLIPFARHVATKLSLVYPDAPDLQYINGLTAPPGNITIDFDDIFRRAIVNVAELWGWLALSLQRKESPLDILASWNLDTGIDENNCGIYWQLT